MSDKLALLENIMGKVDYLLIGGGMCSTFLKANNIGVGKSQVEEDKLGFARGLMEKASRAAVRLVLPEDVVIADRFATGASVKTVPVSQIPSDWYIMDIGPKTIKTFRDILKQCKIVVWNGTMGVFEYKEFRQGTEAIARQMANLKTTTIIGGGSTAEAVMELGLEKKMSHVSTGGGAALEFLEGKTLPGVAALLDR